MLQQDSEEEIHPCRKTSHLGLTGTKLTQHRTNTSNPQKSRTTGNNLYICET